PAERVEHGDEHGRKQQDDRQSSGQVRDRSDDGRRVVLSDEHGEQRRAEEEERDAQVAQVSFPGRTRGPPPRAWTPAARYDSEVGPPGPAAGARASGPSRRPSPGCRGARAPPRSGTLP